MDHGMGTRAGLRAVFAAAGIPGSFPWGRTGQEWVSAIEAGMSLRFGPDLRAFGASIGNVSIEDLEVVVTGPEDYPVAHTCATQTQAARRGWPDMPADLIVLASDRDILYCARAGMEGVVKVARWGPDEGRLLARWSTIWDWLRDTIEHARVIEEIVRSTDA